MTLQMSVRPLSYWFVLTVVFTPLQLHQRPLICRYVSSIVGLQLQLSVSTFSCQHITSDISMRLQLLVCHFRSFYPFSCLPSLQLSVSSFRGWCDSLVGGTPIQLSVLPFSFRHVLSVFDTVIKLSINSLSCRYAP